jgi:hypothetical protein
MAILGRAATELQNGDWTLAIVLGAMAVECDMAYLFMKWKGIDLETRMPGEADREEWEKQWREEVRTVAARLDRVSGLLTGQDFDSFLAQNTGLLKPVHMRYPASKSEPSPKKFFIAELFHRRNRVVHFGEINSQQADGEICLTCATSLSQILSAMDAQRRLALDAKHAAQLKMLREKPRTGGPLKPGFGFGLSEAVPEEPLQPIATVLIPAITRAHEPPSQIGNPASLRKPFFRNSR